MTCEKCGLEMRIAASATRPEMDGAGGLVVYHVNELRCLNRHCSERNRPKESRVVLWSNDTVPEAIKAYGIADGDAGDEAMEDVDVVADEIEIGDTGIQMKLPGC